MIITIIVLLIVSFVVALRSMKDFDTPPEVRKLLPLKKIKGSIVFFKNKIDHYSSSTSSSSS